MLLKIPFGDQKSLKELLYFEKLPIIRQDTHTSGSNLSTLIITWKNDACELFCFMGHQVPLLQQIHGYDKQI